MGILPGAAVFLRPRAIPGMTSYPTFVATAAGTGTLPSPGRIGLALLSLALSGRSCSHLLVLADPTSRSGRERASCSTFTTTAAGEGPLHTLGLPGNERALHTSPLLQHHSEGLLLIPGRAGPYRCKAALALPSRALSLRFCSRLLVLTSPTGRPGWERASTISITTAEP